MLATQISQINAGFIEEILNLEQHLDKVNTAQALYELGSAFLAGKITGFAQYSLEAQNSVFRCFYEVLKGAAMAIVIPVWF